MARAMVMEYGMSEKLGWLRYRDNQEEVFLGHSVARSQHVSEETARLIDQEIRRLIEEAEGGRPQGADRQSRRAPPARQRPARI